MVCMVCRGVGTKLKVVSQNLMASSWQVLWTQLEIFTISESNSVLKVAHARGLGACLHRKILNFSSCEMTLFRWSPFFEGYKKESSRKQFSWIDISLQSAIHVMIGFLIIFGETNFMEIWKSRKFSKFLALEKGPLQ